MKVKCWSLFLYSSHAGILIPKLGLVSIISDLKNKQTKNPFTCQHNSFYEKVERERNILHAWGIKFCVNLSEPRGCPDIRSNVVLGAVWVRDFLDEINTGNSRLRNADCSC